MVSFPNFREGRGDFDIDFKKGELIKIQMKGEPKFKWGTEEFSWHQEFDFSLCLKI